MKILKNHKIDNSIGINSKSKIFIKIYNKSDFVELYRFIKSHHYSVFIVGEGTNIVPPENFEGIVVKPIFDHIDFDYLKNIVSVGSNVNWNSLVNKMVSKDIYGFENLSLIPGSVGAAPVQNIGAYGQEISNLISSVDCFDYKNGNFITLSNIDCNFTYRNSIFKMKNLIIFNVNFTTNQEKKLCLDYASIKEYISDNNLEVDNLTISKVSKIITNIRKNILPDHREVPNAGSFFKNPIIPKSTLKLKSFHYDDLILWDINSDEIKVGSARLIQLIKDKLSYPSNINIYKKHSLIITTNKKASQKELLDFTNQIKNIVHNEFNIDLEIEPTVIN